MSWRGPLHLLFQPCYKHDLWGRCCPHFTDEVTESEGRSWGASWRTLAVRGRMISGGQPGCSGGSKTGSGVESQGLGLCRISPTGRIFFFKLKMTKCIIFPKFDTILTDFLYGQRPKGYMKVWEQNTKLIGISLYLPGIWVKGAPIQLHH